MNKNTYFIAMTLGGIITILGIILSVSNGLYTLLANILYVILFLVIVFVFKMTKKTRRFSFWISIATLVLTFGVKALSDFWTYWNTPKYLEINHKWVEILIHIPSLYLLIGLGLLFIITHNYFKKINKA